MIPWCIDIFVLGTTWVPTGHQHQSFGLKLAREGEAPAVRVGFFSCNFRIKNAATIYTGPKNMLFLELKHKEGSKAVTVMGLLG